MKRVEILEVSHGIEKETGKRTPGFMVSDEVGRRSWLMPSKKLLLTQQSFNLALGDIIVVEDLVGGSSIVISDVIQKI